MKTMLRTPLALLLLALPLAGMAGQFPGPGGMGGPGMNQEERKLVAQFDKNGDKRLNAAERKAAYDFLSSESASGARRGGFGGRGGAPGGATAVTPTPGRSLTPADVKSYPSAKLYDLSVIRTFFLEFEDANWEKELMLFKNTDIEMPATLRVDGRVFKDVGVHFRGMSSFMMVPEGQKHSINVSLDFVHDSQNIGGYRTLNLLNAHEDPTFLRPVLYAQVARRYIPAPQANFARVVINGESWGLFDNVQQFNKDFLRDHFGTTEGARWKVPGSPGARGGLEYSGNDAAEYKKVFEIKSKDTPKAWADLINLARVLDQTAPAKLEAALAPILDIDGTLRFLALDNVLANGDGYWARASDYSIYQDPKGIFHILPQDANETFSTGAAPGGPGGRGGPGGFGGFGDDRGRGGPPGDSAFGRGRGGRGFPPGDSLGGRGRGDFGGRGRGGDGDARGGERGGEGGGRGGMMPTGGPTLDPLVGLKDDTKPLRSRLLAVPALKARYLAYVREIADKGLDWKTLGPMVQQYQKLIEADVNADTRKLDTNAAFTRGLADLKEFADKRRAFLLGWTEKK